MCCNDDKQVWRHHCVFLEIDTKTFLLLLGHIARIDTRYRHIRWWVWAPGTPHSKNSFPWYLWNRDVFSLSLPSLHNLSYSFSILPLFASVTSPISLPHRFSVLLSNVSIRTLNSFPQNAFLFIKRMAVSLRWRGQFQKALPPFTANFSIFNLILCSFSVVTGQYLAKWNYLCPSSFCNRPGACGIHLVYF